MWKFNNFFNNKAAICDDGSFITYKNLQVANEQVANCIFENDIKSHILVFTFCSNTIGSIVGYSSFINNRIVQVLLDKDINSKLLINLLLIYKPAFIWAPANIFTISEVQKDKNISLDSTKFEVLLTEFNYQLIKTNFSSRYQINPDLALLLPTSGSTGSPKLVRQSYKNILSNTQAIIQYLGVNQQERPITTLPMSYTYGLSIINTHLYVGATILLTDKSLMEKEFWTFLKEQKSTSLSGVPYTYEMLEKLRFFKMDLPYLKILTQAGGKLSPLLHKKIAEYASINNKKFIIMYGQTEATARMGYLPFDQAIEKCGSMGVAIPGGDFKLIDAEGQIITDSNVVGELIYEGDNVSLGYASQGEDLIKGDENLGRLITGDMAKRDSDGFFYIVGRKKRFLKLYGKRVNLDETQMLITNEFNIPCVCAGVDDLMHIFVLKKEPLEITGEIGSFISNKLNINFKSFKVNMIDEIPKNNSGKVLYSALEHYFKND